MAIYKESRIDYLPWHHLWPAVKFNACAHPTSWEPHALRRPGENKKKGTFFAAGMGVTWPERLEFFTCCCCQMEGMSQKWHGNDRLLEGRNTALFLDTKVFTVGLSKVSPGNMFLFFFKVSLFRSIFSGFGEILGLPNQRARGLEDVSTIANAEAGFAGQIRWRAGGGIFLGDQAAMFFRCGVGRVLHPIFVPLCSNMQSTF